MNGKSVLCAGIIVADHICSPLSHMPVEGELVQAEEMLLTLGGCAANVAVNLKKMDVNVNVSARVGDDVFGQVVTSLLEEAGVAVGGLIATPNSATSQTLVVNVKNQDRRFIHSFGANAEYKASDITENDLQSASILYLGGYLVMPKLLQSDLVSVFRKAREQNIATVLDVVVPGNGNHLDNLKDLLKFTDVFMPNQDEAALITGEQDPAQQARIFRELGAKQVLITMGKEGVFFVGDNQTITAGVFPVNYVDGSGGGDAFAAGFLYGMIHGLPVQDCITYASALGASCVQAIGTTPGVFTRSECVEFLNKHTLEMYIQ